MEKEMIVTIGELEPNDKVMGVDGKWHSIELLPVHIPKTMYKISFSNGSMKCSGDHEWRLFGNVNDIPVTLNTDTIYDQMLSKKNSDFICNLNVGMKNSGVKIKNVERIEPIPVRCVSISEEGGYLDHSFEIILENEDLEIQGDDLKVEVN